MLKMSEMLKGLWTLSFLPSKWDCWKKPLFFVSQGLCENCLKWEKSLPRNNNKKNGAFLFNVHLGFSSSWNSFHRYHQASWIFVIVHVEKTFREMIEMHGKDFKKKLSITKYLVKTAWSFFDSQAKIFKFLIYLTKWRKKS